MSDITRKTTLQKLGRFRAIIEAEERGERWLINPKRHPLPTLPGQDYLEGPYLAAVEASCPYLAEKARELVTFAGKERRG